LLVVFHLGRRIESISKEITLEKSGGKEIQVQWVGVTKEMKKSSNVSSLIISGFLFRRVADVELAEHFNGGILKIMY